jgi:hypothetical protein
MTTLPYQTQVLFLESDRANLQMLYQQKRVQLAEASIKARSQYDRRIASRRQLIDARLEEMTGIELQIAAQDHAIAALRMQARTIREIEIPARQQYIAALQAERAANHEEHVELYNQYQRQQRSPLRWFGGPLYAVRIASTLQQEKSRMQSLLSRKTGIDQQLIRSQSDIPTLNGKIQDLLARAAQAEGRKLTLQGTRARLDAQIQELLLGDLAQLEQEKLNPPQVENLRQEVENLCVRIEHVNDQIDAILDTRYAEIVALAAAFRTMLPSSTANNGWEEMQGLLDELQFIADHRP